MPRPKPRPAPPARFPEEIGIPLVCPQCRAPVARDAERFICQSAGCRRAYPIDDGIPRFLVGESSVLDEAAWRTAVAGHP